MFAIYFEPHTTGSCSECTDQTPADQTPADQTPADQTPVVVALSAVLAIVVLLLAVAIFTIILLCTSESGVKVSCMCVVCAYMPLRECHYLITDGCA